MKKILEANGLKGYVRIKQTTKAVKEYNPVWHDHKKIRQTFYSIEAYANGSFIASEKDITDINQLENLSSEYERKVLESLNKEEDPKPKGFLGLFTNKGYK